MGSVEHQPQPPGASGLRPPQWGPPYDVDHLSQEGHFGWEKFADIEFAYIERLDKKYSSVRMLKTMLSGRLQPEAVDALMMKSVPATAAEAHLLNVINVHYCDCSFGQAPFDAGDLLVELDAVHSFIGVLNDCLKLCGKAVQADDRCGLIRINKTAVVPYVRIGGNKHVPVLYFKEVARVDLEPEKLELKKMNEWDICYMKFCCRLLGKANYDFGAKEDYFVDLLDATRYLSFYAEVEEYWPGEDIGTHFLMANESDMVNSSMYSIPGPMINDHDRTAPSYEIQPRTKRRYVKRNTQNRLLDDQPVRTVTFDLKQKENEMPNECENLLVGSDVSNSSDGGVRMKKQKLETDSAREMRLKKMRETARQQRLNETPEQREKRLTKLRISQAKRLARETPEQRERRLAKLRHYHSLKKKRLEQTKMVEMKTEN